MDFAERWRQELSQLAGDMMAREERGLMAGIMLQGIMRGDGSAKEPDMPNSEVRSLVMSLNHDLEGLTQSLLELEERLGIVLIPDAPVPSSPGNQAPRERASSSLGQDIEQLRMVVEGQTRRIQGLKFRVAL